MPEENLCELDSLKIFNNENQFICKLMKYNLSITSKLPNTGLTIFAEMSKLADEYGAVNLSRGFPDFNCSDELIELVNQAMHSGFNQYAPVNGLFSLREAIGQKIFTQYTAVYDPANEITITGGATECIFSAITAFVHENDEVIVFEPAYDCYVPAIELCHGKPVFIPLKGTDFHIDWDEVQKNITGRTRLIIINSPHNPTGATLSAQDMVRLDKMTQNTDIIILSDEVYENMVYDGVEHQSITRYPALAQRALVVFSFGKTFHVTGWRVGYCLAPARLMVEFRKVHQYLMYTVNTPIQHALSQFLLNPDHYTRVASFFQEKRDYFQKMLKQTRFRILPCKGTYFQTVDFSSISDERDKVFAERLIKEFGIASIPLSPFYHNKTDHKMLRFCFAKNNETLEMAVERLSKI